MEVHIKTNLCPTDCSALSEDIVTLDPSAVVDFDQAASRLRVSTQLTERELLQRLASHNIHPAKHEWQLVASVCCGGCSG